MKAEVEITTSLNLKLDEVLLESELEILETLGEESVNKARQIWTGWKYGPYYPREQIGESNRSWRFNLMDPAGTGQFVRGVSITNNAEILRRSGTYKLKVFGRETNITKEYSNNQEGKKYAGYVTRSGSSEPEWKVVFKAIAEELVPAARRDLVRAIERNAGKNRTRETFAVNQPSDTTDHFDIVSETLF